MKKSFLLLILSFLLSVTVITAQPLYKSHSSKIHPFFQNRIESIHTNNASSNLMGINFVAQNSSGEKIYEAIVRITDETKILTSNVNINSVLPGFATARLTLDEMVELSKQNYVIYIYPGEIYYPTNDVSNAVIGADLVKNSYINSTAYDGTDVIVLVVDTGIDWTHEDFQNSGSPNTSRILYIWDQTLTKSGSEKTPQDRDGTNFAGLNYGVEYTQANINDEIDGSPTGFVREKDNNGHGTHVSGSAAGNGASLTTAKYSGIASKADIVFVKAGDGSFSTTNLINALKYAEKISDTEGKPVVVNMSLGGQANAHDGTRDLDIAVDDFTSSGNGRVAVIAAGNDGSNAIHITGTTASSSSSNIYVDVPSYTANAGTGDDNLYLDLWWNNGDNVTAKVISPNSYSYTSTQNSSGTGVTDDGYIYIYNYIDPSHTNGDRRNYFKVYDGDSAKPPAQGTWNFRVTNNSASTMTYHAWLFHSSMGATLTNGNTDYTVGSPAVANSAIAVGAYVSRWRWRNNSGSGYAYSGTDRTDNIALFSSIGPRRDGVQKPDVTAPGQGIISCTSKDSSPYSTSVIVSNKYHLNQGTSMATPICAGAVALMLDSDPTLTAAEVKAYITGNADTDSNTGGIPNYTWGYGKLNIFRAMVSSINTISISEQFVAQQDFQYGIVSFPNTPDDYWYSEKFTATMNGKVTGILFHPGNNTSLAADLPIEIWSDNGGKPDSKLGSTVNFDSDALLPYSWNKLYFASGGVAVTSGTTYHAVLKTPATSSFNLIEGGTSHSNYSSNSGVAWNATSDDLGIRVLISPSESATPVELTQFTANQKGNSILLNWTTATEVNNYGFEIQRSVGQKSFLSLGFVEGHGNSNSVKNYSYIDNSAEGGNLKYRLKQIDTDGSFEYSDEVEIVVNKAYKYSMEQNHPNPFNPTTVLNYTIPNKSKVTVEIYNTLGQRVAELINANQNIGKHSVTWNAIGFSSGTYFARFTATSLKSNETFTDVKKLLLIK